MKKNLTKFPINLENVLGMREDSIITIIEKSIF